MNNLKALNVFVLTAITAGCSGGGGDTATTSTTTGANNYPPVVSVSGAATVNAGETVTLKAQASDPNGDQLFYSWSQVSGEHVKLDDEGAANATFLAPSTPGNYIFHVNVNDGVTTVTSSDVTINVIGYSGATNQLSQNPLIELSPIADAEDIQILNNRAYVTAGVEGMNIYDITNPSKPSLLGKYNFSDLNALYLSAVPNRVAIYGYASPYHGVRIVDTSTPSNPVTLGMVVTNVLIVRDVVLSNDGNTLYIATDYGLRIYDISNPAAPVKLTLDTNYTLTDEIKAMELVENGASRTLYTLSGANGGSLNILDVTAPSTSLPILGSLSGFGISDSLHLNGTKIYTTGINGVGLNILDVSTLSAPTLLGSWKPADWTIYDVAVDQNRAYIVDWSHGAGVLDIVDPANISLLGEYLLPGRPFTLAQQGNNLYVVDNGVGVQVLDVSTPGFTQPIRNIGTSVEGRDVAVRNGMAFMVDSSYTGTGLVAFDVSNPLSPSILGSYGQSGGSAAKSLAFYKNFVVTGGGDGLKVIDVQTPSSMKLSGSYTYTFANTIYSSVVVRQNYAYLGTEATPGSLHTFDLADVTKPARIDTDLIGQYDYWSIKSLALDGSNIFIATSGYLYSADLTNPANPVMGGNNSALLYANMSDVATISNKVIVSGSNNLGGVLYCADTSAMPTMTLTSTTELDGNGVAISGRNLYTTQYREFYTGSGLPSLYIYDIADATKPTLNGQFHLPAIGRRLKTSDGYTFVATKGMGMALMQAEPTLSSRYTTALVGEVLSYTVGWNEFPSTEPIEAKCIVTGGSCQVGSVDQTGRQATVTWTMPSTAGDYEMAVVVGDQHSFFTARDRVTAQ